MCTPLQNQSKSLKVIRVLQKIKSNDVASKFLSYASQQIIPTWLLKSNKGKRFLKLFTFCHYWLPPCVVMCTSKPRVDFFASLPQQPLLQHKSVVASKEKLLPNKPRYFFIWLQSADWLRNQVCMKTKPGILCEFTMWQFLQSQTWGLRAMHEWSR